MIATCIASSSYVAVLIHEPTSYSIHTKYVILYKAIRYLCLLEYSHKFIANVAQNH